MGDVAKRAGVARSTVSKALRGDPSISAKLAEKVQCVARRMGYAPHPLVSALMAQIHVRRRRSDPYHLAWVDLWPRGEAVRAVPYWSQHLAGVRERAAELGYSVEVHDNIADRISPGRLRQILTARTQWGIIFPPVPESAMQFPIDLRGLAAVTIGTSLRSPAIHRISHNHFQGVQLACDRLRAKGFKRIGLALTAALSHRVEGKWYGGYLARQLAWPKAERLRPLLIPPDDGTALRRWLAAEKPDAVLLAESRIASWIREGASPAQVVWLTLGGKQPGFWGVDQLPVLVGRAAVELTVGQIHRNERGSPAHPYSLLLDGSWVEG
jgi:DNA-binding LacI/PurR family transcriptional regulator